MKRTKRTIALLAALIMVLTSIPAFAYSPVGAGMLSAYYQNDESSLWQAEVTFERQWGNSVTTTSRPIQYISRNETVIRTTAYFANIPKDAQDAKLIVVLYADNALTAMATAPVDTTQLTAYVDMDVSPYIASGSTVYHLRALVWDGGFNSLKPMTCLREISTASFSITAVTVDGTKYSHDKTGNGSLFVDNALGIVDIDRSVIADITNVDLIITLGFPGGRKLVANGQTYSYNTEADGFVLEDVDLSNGLPITLLAGRSSAYYVINPKAIADFTPNNMQFKKSDGTVIETPASGEEVKLGFTTNAYDKTGTVKVADMGNGNFGNTTYIESFADRIYTSLYNNNGKLLYRMFSDGVTKTELSADVYYTFINFVENCRPESSYVFEMKFKAKAVTEPSETTVTDDIGLAPSAGIRLRNTDNKEIMYLATDKSGRLGYGGSVASTPFLNGKVIAEDTYYMVRVYARKLADGTTAYRYYSYNPDEDSWLAHTKIDNTNARYESNWLASEAPFYRMRLDFNGSGYPSDMYIDYIRVYETEELTERLGGDLNKITDVSVAGLSADSVTIDEENNEISVYLPYYDREGNAVDFTASDVQLTLDDENASIQLADGSAEFAGEGVTRTATLDLTSGKQINVTSKYGDTQTYELKIYKTLSETFDDETPIIQATGEAIANGKTIFKGIGDTASTILTGKIANVTSDAYLDGLSYGYTDDGKTGKAFYIDKARHEGSDNSGAIRFNVASVEGTSDYQCIEYDIRYEYSGGESDTKNLMVAGLEIRNSALLYRLASSGVSYADYTAGTKKPVFSFGASKSTALSFADADDTVLNWHHVKLEYYLDADGVRHSTLWIDGIQQTAADDYFEAAEGAPVSYSFVNSALRCSKIVVDNLRFTQSVDAAAQ